MKYEIVYKSGLKEEIICNEDLIEIFRNDISGNYAYSVIKAVNKYRYLFCLADISSIKLISGE